MWWQMRVGGYDLGEHIGNGGFSQVWATKYGGETCAIKVYESADDLQFFKNEVKVLARAAAVESQHLVRYFDAGIATDMTTGYPNLMPFIVLTRHGPSLHKILKKYELSVDQAKVVARCVLGGLAALHHLGIIHADIKPENVLSGLTNPEHYVIADLGTSVSLGERVTDAVGTPEYLAPEVVIDQMWGTPYDIWGAFAVVYAALTRTPLLDIYGDYDVRYGDDVDGVALERVSADGSRDESDPDALAYRTLLVATKVLGPMPAPMLRHARRYLDAAGQPLGNPVEPIHAGITALLMQHGVRNKSAATFLEAGLRWLPSERPTATEALALPWLSAGGARPPSPGVNLS